MGLKKRWVAVVVIALVMVGAMQAATLRPSVVRGQVGGEDSDAPYLYYFSDDLNAWVIERADGTDRRLLGQGLMVEENNAVGGPGWSPSGKFFAWTGYANHSNGSTRSQNGWIISADGQNIIAHFEVDEEKSRFYMDWSPTSDLLMVVELGQKSVISTGNADFVNESFRLVDGSTGRTLSNLKTITNAQDRGMVVWTQDGRFAITQAHANEDSGTQFYLFSPDGTITERIVFSFGRDMPSPAGTLLLDTPNGPMLVDLIINTTQPISTTWGFPDSFEDEYSRSYTVDWNSTGTHGLIRRRGIWLLDVAAAHIRQITPLNAGGPADWSPDERYIFVTQRSYEEFPGYSYLVEVATGRVFDVPYYEEVDFYGNPNDIGWQWIANQYLLLYGATVLPLGSEWTGETFATLVEVSTGKLETWELGQERITELFISPNLHYLGWIDEGPIMFDRETNLITHIQPNTHSFSSTRGGEIKWHPSQEWLIETKYSSTTGTGLYRWVSIMRPNGTQRRELTLCFNITYCVEWLPKQIDPSTLPTVSMPTPPQITPVQTINVGHWSGFLDWSPDGRLLVVNGPSHTENQYQILDVMRGVSVEVLDIGWDQKVIWQLSQQGDYEVVAIDRGNEQPYYILPKRVTSPDGHLEYRFGDAAGVYDTETGERVLPWGFRWAGFSPDSRLLVGFDPYPIRPVRLIDIESGEIVGELDTPASAVAFSPDGQYLAVGVSWDVEIWRVSDLIGETVLTPSPSPTH